MNKHKEPFFSIRFGNPISGYITRVRELQINIGNYELDIQLAVLFVRWRYCKLCNGIITDGYCDNPRCPNSENHAK